MAEEIKLSTIDDLVGASMANHEHRQKDTFNLIPSENTPSLFVKLLSILDPSGRYAEHRRNRAFGALSNDVFFYQGTDFIAAAEARVQGFFRKYLDCSEAEVRPISGQQSNEIVFKAVMAYLNRGNKGETQRISYVMNHDLNYGGHLSAQQGMGSLGPFVRQNPNTGRHSVANFPLDANNPYQIDLERTKELILQYKPQLLILGKSMVLEQEPIEDIATFVATLDDRPIIMDDRSHVMGLPKGNGADIYTGSVHKTFFGTQRGIVTSNMPLGSEYRPLWDKVVDRTFPGSMSNHHLGTLLGLLGACMEWEEHGVSYQTQVVSNAKSFAKALNERGLKVEGSPSIAYTNTHQVILNVGYDQEGRGRGSEVASLLEKQNIITNAQVLPYDPSSSSASGIRIGVQEMTRFGMKENDFEKLAEYFADILLKSKDRLGAVADYRKRFVTLQYGVPNTDPRVRKLADLLLTT